MQPTEAGRKRLNSDWFAENLRPVAKAVFDRTGSAEVTQEACLVYAASVLAADETGFVACADDSALYDFSCDHYDELRNAIVAAISKWTECSISMN
jgi:hypothetical protein